MGILKGYSGWKVWGLGSFAAEQYLGFDDEGLDRLLKYLSGDHILDHILDALQQRLKNVCVGC